MTELMLYPCGTEVSLKLAETKGLITGICIHDESVTYEVNYCLSNTVTSR